LAEWFDPNDRVATIEDTAELELRHPHVLRLESRSANTEGIGAVSMRDLVRASLRLRPDRLVVGEVRGAEAYDMLQALNTGHAGSLTTVHANDGVAALTRLQTLCMLADSAITAEIARHMVISAVGAVVVVKRLSSGKRVVDQLYDIQAQQLWLRREDNVAQYTVQNMLADESSTGWDEPV
jgi:pilus assembly protein CpaF